MNSESLLANLPPEVREQVAAKLAANTGTPPVPNQPLGREHYTPAPIQKAPSLMDHLIALRQEVAAMRQELAQNTQTIEANSNVVEAVGQAVGTIYQMFQQTPAQGGTYSENFQQTPVSNEDY